MSFAEAGYGLPKFFGSLAAMTKRDLVRFGSMVRGLREDLGLQQEEMKAQGGPSSTTMSGIERGVIVDPAPSTLRKLDVGLRWAPGSAAATLDGGDPEPLPSNAVSTPLEAWKPRGDPREDIPDLIDFAGRIVAAAESFVDVAPRNELATVVHPAVRFIAVAAETIGTKMRQEDGIVNGPRDGASEWIAVYAEQLRELADSADRIAVILAAGDSPGIGGAE